MKADDDGKTGDGDNSDDADDNVTLFKTSSCPLSMARSRATCCFNLEFSCFKVFNSSINWNMSVGTAADSPVGDAFEPMLPSASVFVIVSVEVM
jgi:hypothetical protein